MTSSDSTSTPRRYFPPLPADRSLGAYKNWILDIAQAVGAIEDTVVDTQEKWESDWRDFWQKVGAGVPNKEER